MKKHFYSILRTISSIYEHYNLQNSETTESGVDKVVSSCEKNPNVHKTYMNFLRQRKTALDAPLNVVSSGRSMVEMLGVLAIIGVLSVGAISGYSKAMMKYKMNKFATSMNELLNTCLQYTGRINSASNFTDSAGAEYFSTILHKMNALPDGITYKNNQYLEDMFGNDIWAYAYPNTNHYSGLAYRLSTTGKSELSSEICHQLVNVTKENSSQLHHISVVTVSNSDYYGDAYCSKAKGLPCIKSIKLSDIDTMCNFCQQGKDCRFYIIWK